jgi:hypothetical protein
MKDRKEIGVDLNPTELRQTTSSRTSLSGMAKRD